jgi:carboxyl-terminal processing protease
MRRMRRWRPVSVLAFVVAVSALVGGLLGRSALATDARVPAHYETFSAALAAIQSTYAGTVESDRLVYGAIRGMLATLDPHSSFFDPREYAQMLERQEGRYYGLGITIASIDGDITAQSVFEGSPAFSAGVRRGDVIATVAGESAKGWTTLEAQNKLRGPKGSPVRVEIRRYGYEQPIALEVIRDEVQIRTVRSSFMLDETSGYVQLKDFGENTDRELRQALRDLSGQGMRRLVLDVRGNPGGPLTQAIRVSNTFLPQGSLIVYTRGRTTNSAEDHHAREDGEYTDLPIVVLTSRASASASEIVAGALQDHDRAYIVGETTFGKALVQSVYPISNGAGLALTTAHYYTPSGRLIQRPWDASFDEYLSYSIRDQQANRPHDPSELKRTDSGRPVYSGGGIEPDRHVPGPIEGFNPTPFGRTLYARQTFENFAQRFMAEGDTRILQQSVGRRSVASDFAVDAAMLAEYREFLQADRLRVDEEAFAKDLEFIRAMIRFRIDEAVFSIAEAQRHLIAVDPQAQVALSLFPEAEKLAGLSRPSTISN